MSDDGLLGRAELEPAFAALGDRLFRLGVVADLPFSDLAPIAQVPGLRPLLVPHQDEHRHRCAHTGLKQPR